MKFKKFLKEHYLIIIIILIFLFYRVQVLLNYYSFGFDASIYIGQAKYIYSLGATGYFEPLRPLVLPLIIGIGWLFGFNIIVWGKIIEILFSIGTIILVYIIASKLHNKIAGLISAGLLAITPIYFLYSDKILTGIPSAFFALLSFYFLINKKYWLTGLFAAISFMTRFPQGVLLIAYALTFMILIIQTKGKIRKIFYGNLIKFAIPYVLVVFSYLVFNLFKYWSADSKIEAMFWPFIHGSTTITTSGLWLYSGTFFYYFSQLYKQNYFFMLSFVFLLFYISEKKYKQQHFNFLLIAPILFLIYFTQLPHKEVRFALIFLPYISMLSGIALSKIYNFVENKKKLLVLFFVILLLIIYLKGMPKPSLQEYVEPRVDDVCSFIQENNLIQPVILTTPYPLYCINNKIDMNLFSIPILLETMQENPDWIIIYAPETFICAPENLTCHEQKQTTLNKFKSQFNTLYYNNNTNYPIYIFQKFIS